MSRRSRRHAAPPTESDRENRRKNRLEARNEAPSPTSQDRENRRRNRAQDRAAAPAVPRQKAQECCGKHTYRVTANRSVHGKKKGETVELCDNGATQALIQAGALVPVTEKAAVEKAEPKKEASDG